MMTSYEQWLAKTYPDRPFAKGSDTSWYAAHSIPKARLSSLKRQILGYLRSLHPRGATDDELSTALNEYRYTVAPRRRWLVVAGLVVDSGVRRTGPRGRKQVVWLWNIEGSYKEPKKKSVPKWIAELSYPQALKVIDNLHELRRGGLTCVECNRPWPCQTHKTINKARLRRTGEKNGKSVRTT